MGCFVVFSDVYVSYTVDRERIGQVKGTVECRQTRPSYTALIKSDDKIIYLWNSSPRFSHPTCFVLVSSVETVKRTVARDFPPPIFHDSKPSGAFSNIIKYVFDIADIFECAPLS